MASLLQRFGWWSGLWFPREWTPQLLHRLGVSRRSSYAEVEEAILRYLAHSRGIETDGKTEREVVMEILSGDVAILERQRERESVNAVLDEASRNAQDLEAADTCARAARRLYLYHLQRGST